jgi:hypothetical protein
LVQAAGLGPVQAVEGIAAHEVEGVTWSDLNRWISVTGF